MVRNIRLSHVSVRTCEQWQNGWLDVDAFLGWWVGSGSVWVYRFWWWSSKGKGQFGVNTMQKWRI